MKILLASTSNENFSGASKCLIELAYELKMRNHEVIVSIPKSGGELENDLENLHIQFCIVREYQCWYKKINKKTNFFSMAIKSVLNEISVERCRKYLRLEKFDIVHVNAITAYVVGKAAIMENIPVVWHIREFMEEDLGITFVNKAKSLKILNKSTQFIAISQVIKEKWSKYIKRSINVVYDGVSIDKYCISEKSDHDEINILLYGRIVQGKGQLFYINAANKVLDRIHTKCKFYFAGKIEDENYYNQCNEIIYDNNRNKDVQYIGEINDIKKLLKETDIVCVCSSMEGFGRVTVESMLGKCLVIGADSGATAELIKDNETGILYKSDSMEDFCEKLVECIDNFERYYEVINNGQKDCCNRFTDNKNVESILSIYENVKK